MKLLKAILSIAIVLTGLFGDYVVFRSKYAESFVFRAAADSAVHATIGFLSASLFFSHRLNIPSATCIYYILFCTLVSSLIDVDHVFVAKSIHLKVRLSYYKPLHINLMIICLDRSSHHTGLQHTHKNRPNLFDLHTYF